MAAVLLFWNTNMATVTSCENAIFRLRVTKCRGSWVVGVGKMSRVKKKSIERKKLIISRKKVVKFMKMSAYTPSHSPLQWSAKQISKSLEQTDTKRVFRRSK